METLEIPVDETLRANAQNILAVEGLTLSEAFSMVLQTIVHERRMPSELLTPNAATVQAMKDAEEGRLHSAHSVKEFMDALREND